MRINTDVIVAKDLGLEVLSCSKAPWSGSTQ